MAAHLWRDNKHTHTHRTREWILFRDGQKAAAFVCALRFFFSVSINTAKFNAVLTFCALFHFNHFDNCVLHKPTQIPISSVVLRRFSIRFCSFYLFDCFSFTYQREETIFFELFILVWFHFSVFWAKIHSLITPSSLLMRRFHLISSAAFRVQRSLCIQFVFAGRECIFTVGIQLPMKHKMIKMVQHFHCHFNYFHFSLRTRRYKLRTHNLLSLWSITVLCFGCVLSSHSHCRAFASLPITIEARRLFLSLEPESGARWTDGRCGRSMAHLTMHLLLT